MADFGKVDLPSNGAAASMVSAVWTAVGTAFFRELAKHLSGVLGAHLVYIGEFSSASAERMDCLSAATNGEEAEGFEYYLAGTPCQEVIARGMVVYERGIRRAFPSDPILEQTGAEAFVGKALFDSRGQPIGAIFAVWRDPLVDSAPSVSMFQAFAPRAAAELERKRAEDSLRKSEQRYRAFIANSTDVMYRLEFENPIPIELPENEQIGRMYRYGYVAECNDAMARMLGAASADALLGARLGEMFASPTAERIEDLQNVIRSGYKADNVEIRIPLEKNGASGYRLRSHTGIIENGKLLRFWITVRDIGNIREMEHELQESESRFRRLLETIRMAAVMLDREGGVTFCNDYLLGITGWSKDDLLGKSWFDVAIPEEDRDGRMAAFSELISGGMLHSHFEAPVIGRNGARHLIDWDATSLMDGKGNIIGTARLGKDITDQRALQARLNASRRLESVGQLAGRIAHDFRNLLMIIRGYATFMLEPKETGPKPDAAREVIRASEQGEELTRQLLAFSRNQPMEPRPLNLNELIVENEKMLRMLIGEKIELNLDLDPSPRTVLADPGQLHQVLVNLAKNARDAMAEGGKLTIVSRKTDIGENRPAAMPEVPPGRYMMLEFADTGAGMPEEVRAHLFEPFFTTKGVHGTGLGLSSVYGIVLQSGGDIFVDSAPGKGSTFHILLPASP